MKARLVLTALLLAGWVGLPGPARAAVVIIANRTDRAVRFTIQPPKGKAEPHTLAAGDLAPVPVAGGVEIAFTSGGKELRYALEPNAAYFFGNTPAGLNLEQIGIGDKPEKPPADTGPSPLVKKLTIPVKLLVDDDEPAARKVWEDRLRKRLQAASDVIERHCRVRFEVVAVETWESDNAITDFREALQEFEQKVKPDKARLAVGYTSQFPNPGTGGAHLGSIRSILHTHILIREWYPRGEPERLEVLVHELGHFLGAAHSPEPDSVMRPKLADGQARASSFRIHFDPLNALAMCLVAEEIQTRGVKGLNELGPAAREPIGRVYAELARALPEDAATVELARTFPKVGTAEEPPVSRALADGTRRVVAAVVRAAERNQKLPPRGTAGAEAPFRLTGDALTEAYVREAAAEAQQLPARQAVPAFLLGIGIALDSSDLLRTAPPTRALCAAIESDEEHRRRLGVLGLPTMRGRHDLAQHFAIAAALTSHVGPALAEAAGLLKEQLDMQAGGSGFSFADVAAGLAGIVLAERLRATPEQLARLAESFAVRDYMPDVAGLREGLSQEAFAKDFGSFADERFRGELAAIRKRVLALPGHKNIPLKD